MLGQHCWIQNSGPTLSNTAQCDMLDPLQNLFGRCQRLALHWNQNTVESPVSDYWKREDVIVAYQNWTKEGLPWLRPRHVCRLEENLFHVTMGAVPCCNYKFLWVAWYIQQAQRSEYVSSGRLDKLRNRGKLSNSPLKKRFHLSGFNWENAGILDGSHVEVYFLWYVSLRRLSHDAITWLCSSSLFVFTYKAKALRWMKRIKTRKKIKGKTNSSE